MATELFLPPHLPYPIRVVSLDVRPPSLVQRGTRLLSYSFSYHPPDAPTETRFGTWDSTVEGTLDAWKLKQGQVVSGARAKETPAVLIVEPCKHGVQIGGMCALCGKDMTGYDYTGFSDASRASIQMTHLANGPMVSLEEAQKIERETSARLLKARKLSLIVDLDQTIVHATVDPTVGEWIAEGEAWEARHEQKAAEKANGNAGEDHSPASDTSDGSDDEVNPNWEALKDVKKFRLAPETLGAPFFKGPNKGKAKMIEDDGAMYYIKPRPGWQEFLPKITEKYEMHIYTMGTRAYAEQVCNAIDPEGKLFGGRILSRDESGSLTQKSLQRLFPCDTSMVVIIDDRADVWEWSPNLIKVIPYDFFVGIGDINSAFLPKLDPTSSPALSPAAKLDSTSSTAVENAPVNSSDANSPDAGTATSSTTPSADSPPTDREKDEMLTQNTLALEAQMEERPLAKRQEELQSEDSSQGTNATNENSRSTTQEPDSAGTSTPEQPESAPAIERPMRKALLKNDDRELQRVEQLLDTVHETFYAEYEANVSPEDKQKPGHRRRESYEMISYDVKAIIPRIRMDTFDGVHLVFSSLIPLDVRPQSTDIWRTAVTFGAQCYTELDPRVTHVVAAKRGTAKVDAARRRPNISVVWFNWFTDSVALWRRQDERAYLLDPGEPSAESSSPPIEQQTSSDLDLDSDDAVWAFEEGNEEVPQQSSGVVPEPALHLDEVAWDDINDEVDAAMNDSDTEDERSETGSPSKNGMISPGTSDDEGWSDETGSVVGNLPSTPRHNRKRLRSLTPSEAGINGGYSMRNGSDDSEQLRSPLSKRKKLAAGRESKLKEEISPNELGSGPKGPRSNSGSSAASRSNSSRADDEDDGDGGEDEDGGDVDDDFLARELEEDWS